MTTLYKQGSQFRIRFDGVDYHVDIVKSKDEKELSEFKSKGYVESLPETLAEKEAKPKSKKKDK